MAPRMFIGPAKWLHPDSGLGPMDKLVLAVICQWTNSESQAFPAVRTIALYAGISDRSVQRSLKILARVGALLVERRMKHDKPENDSNIYTVLGFDPVRPRRRGGDTQSPGGGDKDGREVVTHSHPNVSTTNVSHKRAALAKPARFAGIKNGGGEGGRLQPTYESDPPLCRWCNAHTDTSGARIRVVHAGGCLG